MAEQTVIPATAHRDFYADMAYFNAQPFITLDLLRMICGEKIGQGAYRAVYQSELRKDEVIKIARIGSANMIEFKIWEQVHDEPNLAKWFAPCVEISHNGYILFQKKCSKIPSDYKLPKNIPALFTDIKRENWGIYKGRLVCHDYQFLSSMISCGMVTRKKADW